MGGKRLFGHFQVPAVSVNCIWLVRGVDSACDSVDEVFDFSNAALAGLFGDDLVDGEDTGEVAEEG